MIAHGSEKQPRFAWRVMMGEGVWEEKGRWEWMGITVSILFRSFTSEPKEINLRV